jgi:Transglycosylase SLT domain
MNPTLQRLGIATASLAVISMIFSIFTVGVLFEQKKVTHSVVRVQEVILITDKQRIDLLIDELLTPKSAACFRNILKHESNFNPKAKNPYSSARGVGQLLAETYQNLGMKHSSDGMAQTVAALAYISRHYGGANSTCVAWKAWQKKFYY